MMLRKLSGSGGAEAGGGASDEDDCGQGVSLGYLEILETVGAGLARDI